HGGRYWLQMEWSNDDNACKAADEWDRVSFGVPAKVPGDRSIALRGSASDPDGSITRYAWSFGDGHKGRGRSTSHAFTRAGTFTIGLRTTNGAGNWAFAFHNVQVTVPPPPRTRI